MELTLARFLGSRFRDALGLENRTDGKTHSTRSLEVRTFEDLSNYGECVRQSCAHGPSAKEPGVRSVIPAANNSEGHMRDVMDDRYLQPDYGRHEYVNLMASLFW